VIETLETATKTSFSKGSMKKGKNPFQGVETTLDIEKAPESKRRKVKGRKLIFTTETKKKRWKNLGNHSPSLQQRI
jgi:hypothetical protein